MDDAEFRAEINRVKSLLVTAMDAAGGVSIGAMVPALMELVMSACLSLDTEDEALRATNSLRPMVDHIERQIRGTH